MSMDFNSENNQILVFIQKQHSSKSGINQPIGYDSQKYELGLVVMRLETKYRLNLSIPWILVILEGIMLGAKFGASSVFIVTKDQNGKYGKVFIKAILNSAHGFSESDNSGHSASEKSTALVIQTASDSWQNHHKRSKQELRNEIVFLDTESTELMNVRRSKAKILLLLNNRLLGLDNQKAAAMLRKEQQGVRRKVRPCKTAGNTLALQQNRKTMFSAVVIEFLELLNSPSRWSDFENQEEVLRINQKSALRLRC